MVILYPDEVAYSYLRSAYTPYRNALPDPTVLPDETDVLWNSYLSGVHDTSFIVTEDYQQPKPFSLGWGSREWNTSFTIYVMTIWISEGKPPYLKEFSKFLEKYLIVAPVPATIKTAGIAEMYPRQFALTQGLGSVGGFIGGTANIQNPETDIWILAVNVASKYLTQANV